MKLSTLTLAAALAVLLGQSALAEEFEVKMLNKGEKGAMVFEPNFVKAKVGDTIRFVPTDKGHNAETIPGMLPDGADALAGKTNEEVVLTLATEGVYGVRCKPHFAMGMVALIVAGEPVNQEAAESAKTPGKAGKVMKELFEQIGE